MASYPGQKLSPLYSSLITATGSNASYVCGFENGLNSFLLKEMISEGEASQSQIVAAN